MSGRVDHAPSVARKENTWYCCNKYIPLFANCLRHTTLNAFPRPSIERELRVFRTDQTEKHYSGMPSEVLVRINNFLLTYMKERNISVSVSAPPHAPGAGFIPVRRSKLIMQHFATFFALSLIKYVLHV